MQKVTVIQRDFERYVFPVQIKQLISLGKKKLIFSELEKRHPCFTNDFCFDDRLSYSRSGLYADVIVIRRNKLLEYQKKNGNSRGIYFENCSKRRFRDFYFCLKILLFIVFVTSVLLLLGRNLWTEKNEISGEVQEILIEEVNDDIYMDENQKLYESLFGIVKQEKGKIEKLVWRVSGGKQIMDFAVSNIYPETLKGLIPDTEQEEFSSVLYQNGLPQFHYSVKKHAVLNCSAKTETNSIYKKELRDLLEKKGCVILEENINPSFIRFTSDDAEIFKEIENILRENEISIEEIQMDVGNQRNKNVIQVKMILNELFEYKWGFRLGVLLENREIFFPEEKKKTGSLESKPEIKEREKASIPMDYKKIGEVKYETGTKVVFYKNDKGKILKIMESMK